MTKATKLGLILGDQLSLKLATLRALDPADSVIVMAEVDAEATYVRHHPQKIALIFSAMRHHAEVLRAEGWNVHYETLKADANGRSLLNVLEEVQAEVKAETLVITECGEYRLHSEMQETWGKKLAIDIELLADDRFFCTKARFQQWAEGRKQLRMEYFYREMRREHHYLLTAAGEPEGGEWNYDQKNRETWSGEPALPERLEFERDAIDQEVLELVANTYDDHPGSLDAFHWPTTRKQALAVLETFLEQRLPHFGTYQDAMVTGADWLFHSLLSPAINCGLLDPKEVCDAAEQAYHAGRAPLNAVEGFIRQILGWREYVRGIYWWQMPDYAERNDFEHERPLPEFFWSGETEMFCLQECFRNTFEHAYAHHIQRLMIIGNFALLAGLSPKAVCEWYLLVYADAYEWVELPNTLGMILHADGGLLGSKPYAASGNYIHKMSDYCKHCHYNVKTTVEQDSCPFNSLYWHFIARHRQRLEDNPRMKLIYGNLDRQNEDKRTAQWERAETLLADLSAL